MSLTYAMAVPVAIMDASIHTRSPRLCEREVSATQDGIVEVFMPAMIFSQKSLCIHSQNKLTISDAGD